MAEECGDGYDLNEVKSVKENVNDLQYDQLRRGVIFNADVEDDFFLDNNVDVDEEEVLDQEAELDETDLTWNKEDPNEASATMDYLRTPPLPIKILRKDVMPLIKDYGVQKLILEYGEGSTYPERGARVYYHYSAWVENSPEPFDTSVGRNAEALIIGEPGDVLRGVRLAVESMKRHEVAQFVIAPDYAYGQLGCPPRVGKDALMIFTIKVVHVVKEEKLKSIGMMNPTERNALSFDVLLTEVETMRRSANTKYKNGDFSVAVRMYRTAVDIMEGYWGVHTKDEEEKRFDFLCSVFCNMAQAYLKMKKGPQSCSALNNALRYKVPHLLARIYLLFARAQALLGSFERAEELLQMCEKYGGDSDKSQCLKYRAQFQESKRQEDARYKHMCKSMFNMKTLSTPKKDVAASVEEELSPEEADSLDVYPNSDKEAHPVKGKEYTYKELEWQTDD